MGPLGKLGFTLTRAARRLEKDVLALGGDPSMWVNKRGYFGTIGQTESVNVTFRSTEFDDAAFARLAEAHGGRIGGLYLENTGVRHLPLMPMSKKLLNCH